MTDNLVPAGFRLAIRREGRFINAYLVDDNTMEDATYIGSILVTLVESGDGFFERWKTLMTEMFAAIIKDTLGLEATMQIRPAPEHERGGHG